MVNITKNKKEISNIHGYNKKFITWFEVVVKTGEITMNRREEICPWLKERRRNYEH